MDEGSDSVLVYEGGRLRTLPSEDSALLGRSSKVQ